MVIFHAYPGFPIEYQRDGEAEHFAKTLISQREFTNPYLPAENLPSSLRAPLHPLLLASLLAISGGSDTPYLVLIYSVFAIISSLTVVLVFLISSRCVGQRAGMLAALMFALYPPSNYYATNATCDATLVCACLAALTLAAQFSTESTTLPRALAFGALAGACALINPSTLSVSVPYGLWISLKRYRDKQRCTLALVLMGVAGAAVVSPWITRNRAVFGQWVFIRSNFGTEFWAANSGTGTSFIDKDEFHMNRPAELAHLRRLGEAAYGSMCFDRAYAWIAEDPIRFALLSMKRICLFWGKEVFYGAFVPVTVLCTGLPFLGGVAGVLVALKGKLQIWPIAMPLIAYPLVYYVTHAQARFRFPVDMYLIIFCAHAITCALRYVHTHAAKRASCRTEARGCHDPNNTAIARQLHSRGRCLAKTNGISSTKSCSPMSGATSRPTGRSEREQSAMSERRFPKEVGESDS